MKVLSSGDAGYIGSHTVVPLCASGHKSVIVDNFSSSRRDVIVRLESICESELEVHECDVTDAKAVERVFGSVRPEAAIHFGGLKSVSESVREPLRYYESNANGTLVLIREALNAGDVAASWADVTKARASLGWHASIGLEQMCRSAWHWTARQQLKS